MNSDSAVVVVPFEREGWVWGGWGQGRVQGAYEGLATPVQRSRARTIPNPTHLRKGMGPG